VRLAVDTIPLEGAYFVLAVAGVLVGFFAMRWHGLSRGEGSSVVGGILYILGRTSLVAGLLVIAWKQALQIDVPVETWQGTAYRVLLVIIFCLMTLSSVLMLAWSVIVDRFGSKDIATSSDTRKSNV
jgi:hypothetical protein